MKPNTFVFIKIIYLFALCGCTDSKDGSNNRDVKTYTLGNAYWYSTHLDEQREFYIGDLVVVGSRPNQHDRTEYTFTITDVVKSSPNVPSKFNIGDKINSSTHREVANRQKHILYLSRYPNGSIGSNPADPDIVTDGGSPLEIDVDLETAINIVRSSGFDPAYYADHEYIKIRKFIYNPDMYDGIRSRMKANNKAK